MKADEIIELVHEIDEKERLHAEILKRLTELRGRLEQVAAKLSAKADDSAQIRLSVFKTFKRRESPRQALAIAHIQSNPKATYQTLVQAVYGSNSHGDVMNARSLISHMKSAELIAGEPGDWRVIDKGDPNGAAKEGL